MTEQDPSKKAPASDCDDLTEAALGAERLISRMQDSITETIQPESDQKEGLNELIGELDPAPEERALREALGMDPDKGTRALPEDQTQTADGARPGDTPPEYQTWRTGP